MAAFVDRHTSFGPVKLHRNWLFALLAVAALGVSVGFWWWNFQTKVTELKLDAGVALKYRTDLTKILHEEALADGLEIQFQNPPSSTPSAETPLRDVTESSRNPSRDATKMIARLDNHDELDAAVIPAGLGVKGEHVRQVAMLECELLHLFVRPDILPRGVAGLRRKRICLGAEGSGVRIVAGKILDFIGMSPDTDFRDETYGYRDFKDERIPQEMLPDAVFVLAPLPSPFGELLAKKYGYQLMELPFGEAMALKQPYLEDACVPANTYGVRPAVPEGPLHTIGTRSVLIAHCDVSKVAIRRLLEVLYESDFARRVGMRPLDAKLLERSGEYPNHAGTIAYLHRHDPWVNTDLIEKFKKLWGMVVSAISALLLAWQWFKRGGNCTSGAGEYLRVCNALELDALRAASGGEFGEGELDDALSRAAELKIDVLQKNQEGLLAADHSFADLLARIEHVERSLPLLVSQVSSEDRAAVALPPRRRAS